MTVARLILEIRRRVAHTPADVPVTTAIERAVREALKCSVAEVERDGAVKILAALFGTRDGEHFDASILDALTPETIFRLDAIASTTIEPRPVDRATRTLRTAIETDIALSRRRIARAIGAGDRYLGRR